MLWTILLAAVTAFLFFLFSDRGPLPQIKAEPLEFFKRTILALGFFSILTLYWTLVATKPILSWIQNHLLAAILSLSLAVLWTYYSPSSYKIYVATDFERNNKLGRQIDNGFRFACFGENRVLKFFGLPVDAKEESHNQDDVASAAQRIINDEDVIFVLGHFYSDFTNTALRQYMASPTVIPLILPTETSTSFPEYKAINYPLLRLAPTNRTQAKQIAELLKLRRAQSVGIIFDEKDYPDYSTSLVSELRESLGQREIRTMFSIDVEGGGRVATKPRSSSERTLVWGGHEENVDYPVDAIIYLGSPNKISDATRLIETLGIIPNEKHLDLILSDLALNSRSILDSMELKDKGVSVYGFHILPSEYLLDPNDKEQLDRSKSGGLTTPYRVMGEEACALMNRIFHRAEELARAETGLVGNYEKFLRKIGLWRAKNARKYIAAAMREIVYTRDAIQGKVWTYVFDENGAPVSRRFYLWPIETSELALKHFPARSNDYRAVPPTKYTAWSTDRYGRQSDTLIGEKVTFNWKSEEQHPFGKKVFAIKWWKIMENNQPMKEDVSNVSEVTFLRNLTLTADTLLKAPGSEEAKASGPRAAVFGWCLIALDRSNEVPSASELKNKPCVTQDAQLTFGIDTKNLIVKTRKIRVGISDYSVPGFAQIDMLEVDGFEIEIVKHIAKNVGDELISGHAGKLIDIELYTYPFDRLLRTPNDLDVDLIISQISANKEREIDHHIRFSNKYYSTTKAIAYVADDCPELGESMSLEAVLKRVPHVITMKGTTSHKLVSDVFSKMKNEELGGGTLSMPNIVHKVGLDSAVEFFANGAFGNKPDSREAESTRPCAVLVDDYIALTSFLEELNNKEQQKRYHLTRVDAGATGNEKYGIAVRAGDKWLLEKINFTLRDLEENQCLRWLEEWFEVGSGDASEYSRSLGEEERCLVSH